MVGLLGEGKMDRTLEAEIEQIVDRQLQELGFIDLCTRIAHKVVEKVQKIDEEHSLVKHELNNIEQKINLFFEKKPAEKSKDVIVIEEDEEKPLVERLHAISKSPSSISLTINTKDELTTPVKQLSMMTGRFPQTPSPKQTNTNTDINRNVETENQTSKIPESSRENLSAGTKRTSDPQLSVSIGPKRTLDGENSRQKSIETSDMMLNMPIGLKRTLAEDSAHRKSIDSESDVAKSSIISESHGYHSSQMTIISKSPIAKTVLLAKSLEDEMPLMSKVAASAGSASRINQPLLEAKNQNVTDDNIESQLAPKIKIKLKPGRKPKHETILARKNASNSPALSDTDPLDTTVRRNSRPVITTGSPNKPLQLSEISEYTASGQDSSKSASPFVVTQDKSQEAKTADQEIAKNLTTAKRGVHKFKEGDRVLAKQDKSDIWYEGTISKTILNKYGQEKFQVRFDHGHKMHGTIPVNNLALLVNPESDDLNVGSRIVAARPKDTVDARIAKKYISLASLSKSKDDILFGGIVVERACEDNKNRFLVFFDDGFAQYLTVKKMHHVIHAAEKVWEDVSINCREFIKEYLEEYPDRPMVKLKSTLSIQTEWNGRWLQARVISVDGSLVKMLFDIDRRTEWIYRGSTRLEPLYSELERRDLEALKAKAKKPGRKKKSTSQTKKVEPYIDDDITKPCYGHSKYSLTDPTGILQRNFWDPIMEATAKEAATSEVTEEPDYSIPETDPKSVSSVTSIESSEPDCTPGPLKIAFNFDKRKTATATTSKSSFQATKHALKRKLDDSSGHDSDGSADVTNFDKSKKRGTDEDPSGLKSPSKYSSNSPNHRSSLHRQSSHSSIDSHYSDSQSRHSSHSDNQSKSSSYIRGRLERQSSNTSMSTNQSARSLSRSRRPSSTSSNQSNAENQSQAIPDVSSVKSPKSLVKQIEYLVRPVEVVSRKRGSSLERYLIAMTNKNPLSKSQTGLASETASPFQQMYEQQTKQMSMRVASQSHPKMRGSHDCTSSCGSDVFIPFHERKLHNPLSIPLLLGWTRETAKRRPGYHRDIYYRSPCNKRLRNMAEVTKYLLQNNITNVSIDQFSFDSSVSCRDQLRFVETPRVHFDDISCGREAFPIQCVNEKSDEQPPLIEYISKRIVGDDIKLDMDPGFLACCDCTDFCQDKSKCACARLTIDTSDAIDGKKDENCGYLYRRVKECVTTGIYECNQNCSCSSSCYNRVVQNGIGLRLQIFMTNHKGWGVRCLDDIPRGTFICTYTGQILNEEMADKEGTDFGDEYLAELDHIEVVEQAKDGYESDVPELKNEKRSYNRGYSENSNKESDSDDESEFAYSTSSECSDNAKNATYAKEETADMELPSEAKDERPQSAVTLGKPLGDVIDLTLDSDNEDETYASRQDNTTNVTTSNDVCEPSDANKQASLQQMIENLRTRLASDKVSSSKSSDATPRSCREESKVLHQTGSHRVLDFQSPASINVESSENDVKQTFPEATSEDGKANIKDISKPDSCSTAADVAYDKGIDYDADAELRKAAAEVVPHLRKAVARKSSMSILQMLVSRKAKCDVDGNEKQLKEAMNASSLERVVNADVSLATCSKTFTSPRSSTGGYFARKLTSMRPQITPPTQTDVEKTETENKNGTRSLYGEDHCYVIDAKSFGNVGRYLNHSCMPNLFVQNVFVDTHDLRFPLVAFFAQQNIPAMTELTWDYSYDVGSVPGKVLICCCGALECRGRLL